MRNGWSRGKSCLAHRGRQAKENDARIIHHLTGGFDAELAHDAGEIEKFRQIVIRRWRHGDAVLLGLFEAEAHIADDFRIGVEKEKRVVAVRQEIDEPRFVEIVGVNKPRLNDRCESGIAPGVCRAFRVGDQNAVGLDGHGAARAVHGFTDEALTPAEPYDRAFHGEPRVAMSRMRRAIMRQRFAKDANAANVAARPAGTAKRS